MKTKYLLYILVFSLISINAISQDSEYLNLRSPHNTIFTHINSLDKPSPDWNKAASTMYQKGITGKKAMDYARKLKEIYEAKGISISYSEFPKNPNFTDSSNGEHIYTPFKELPEIYLQKTGDKWYYSEESVSAIPHIYSQLFPFGKDLLPNLFAKAGDKQIFSLNLWQIYGLLIFLAASVILYYFFSWFFGFLLFRLVHKFFGQEIARKFIQPVARPLSLLLVIFIFLMLWPMLQFETEVNKNIIVTGKIFISIFAMMIFYRLVDVIGAYLDRAAKRTESTLDDQLVPLVNKTLKIFVILVGSLFILQNFGLNITALLAGLSIGGLAFALAAQDTIKNLFGSLMIFLDKPFQIGDWIITDKVDGTVEEVGFRSTKVRTFKNSLITIPNGKLADMAVDNMGARSYRRLSTHISITYDTPPEKIESFTEGIKSIIKAHPHTRKDYYIVELHEMANYSLNVLLYIFFKAETWSLELKYRHEILLAIIRLAEELDIRFAFPTETLFLEEMPGQKSLSPQHNRNKEEHRKKINAFLNSLKKTKAFGQKPTVRPEQKPTVRPEQKPQKNTTQSSQDKRPQVQKDNNQKLHKSKNNPRVQENKKNFDPTPQHQVRVKLGKELTENEIIDVAKELKIEVAALKAIIEVESKGKGFYQDGKPEILFEGHRFWKELLKKEMNPEELKIKFPDIIYQRWTKKFYKGNEKEYDRLEKAKNINKEAAYLSTKWGLFKIPGSIFASCGYKTINEFVYNQYQTEKEQLETLSKYLVNKQLVKDIQDLNWKAFARKYNGPNFAKGKYDTNLEQAYQKIKNMK